MNHVQLIGRFSRDPMMNKTASGTTVARFSLAVDRRVRRNAAQNQQTVDFIDCVAYGKTAEHIGKYFQKGKPAAITGRLETFKHDKNGMTVYGYNVLTDSIEFVGSRKDNKGTAAQASQAAPAQQAASYGQPPYAQQSAPAQQAAPDDGWMPADDEDLPFNWSPSGFFLGTILGAR